MRESCTSGSVRGVPGDRHLYSTTVCQARCRLLQFKQRKRNRLLYSMFYPSLFRRRHFLSGPGHVPSRQPTHKAMFGGPETHPEPPGMCHHPKAW
jgi:hypothetical protein